MRTGHMCVLAIIEVFFTYISTAQTGVEVQESTLQPGVVFVPSHLRTSSRLQMGRRQMGWSHMATFCPICRWAFCPICRHFVQSAYWTKCSQMGHPVCRWTRLQTGQNVGRWAIPSANESVWLHFAQSADGTSADGTSHLPTFCPICRHFIHTICILDKSSQMGHPVCRRDRMQTGQNVGRWAVPSADGTRRQMGRNIFIWNDSSHRVIFRDTIAQQRDFFQKYLINFCLMCSQVFGIFQCNWSSALGITVVECLLVQKPQHCMPHCVRINVDDPSSERTF